MMPEDVEGPEQDRVDRVPAGEPRGPQRERSFVEETRERVRKAKETERRLQTAVKTTATIGKAVAAANPMTLGVLATIIIIGLLLFMILFGFTSCQFGGAGKKASDESGGSIASALDPDNPDHRKLVEDVIKCTQGGDPVLISNSLNLAQELNWSEEADGDKYHKLDNRVMSTLWYLCDSWVKHGQGKIGVNLLSSNGPAVTRVGTQDASGGFKLVDSNSAYRYSQAVGIDAIGLTSPELTRALGLSKPIPVQVSWQLTTSEKLIRPLYERIETDAAELYSKMNFVFDDVTTSQPTDEFWKGLADAHQAVVGYGEEDAFTLTLKRMDLLAKDLGELGGVSGLDDRASGFAGLALEKLNGPLTILLALEQEDGVAFMREWAKKETQQSLRDGIFYSFKAMQVANMVGWYGNTNKIYLWKAYEARQNIRQLVLDLLRMPIELAGDKGEEFNSIMAVNQLIVYSPEDDLDNNLPDLDVYPKGMVAVSEGGVAFDDTDKDGKLMLPDRHFSSLPIDNGPFVKACTTFVYKVKENDQEGIDRAKSMLDSLAPSASIEQMCNLLYGPITYPADEGEESEEESIPPAESDSSEAPSEPEEIEMAGRVTYQKFVHIAF